MALENILCRIGLKAVSDLRTYQFYALQLVSGTDLGANLATASTQKPGGILQNKPNTNQAVDAAFVGICKYLAGGTIHVGDRLTATTDGTLIATTTIKHFTWGYALTEASSGDVATMWVNIGGARDSGN
jgi:hypothetical protein